MIIETPAGSRNKFSFDVEQGIFAHKTTLPAGMASPTTSVSSADAGADGDPIDVLLLMDEPAFPGISVEGRLIGVIEGQQIDGKKKTATTRSSCCRGDTPLHERKQAQGTSHRNGSRGGRVLRQLSQP